MPLSWPLPLSEFMAGLPIAGVTFRLGRSVTFSETGGGELITHALGARLWQGEIRLGRDYHRVWAAIEARLAILEEPGASLLISDPRLPGPIEDPDGAILGAASVQIKNVLNNNQSIRLKGLPVGYKLSQGDFLSFEYGSNPTRYALHRVITTEPAGPLGERTYDVTPYVRPGWVEDTPVQLLAPSCKARITETEIGASRATVSDGGVFRWKQTLR